MRNNIKVLAEEAGIPQSEFALNLRNLAANTLDPIKQQYSDMVVIKLRRTIPNLEEAFSLARAEGKGAALQFTNHSYAEYLSIAQWIRNNVSLTQLQLQFYTTTATEEVKAFIGVAWGSTPGAIVSTTYNGTIVARSLGSML